MPALMDVPARLWLIKTARREFWRVAGFYDLDDLIADGALCWQIVACKYPEVSERRNLMALFQRTYTNHIHKIANKRTKHSVEELCSDELLDQPSEDSEEELRRFAAEQKGDLHALLLTIIDHPELLKRPHRRRLSGRRQDTNSWLCGLIGLDPRRHDLAAQLHKLLGRPLIARDMAKT